MRRIGSILKGLALGAVAVASPRAFADTRAFVVVYDGWGTPTSFSVSGRVLEDQHENAPDPGSGEAENIVDNMKALESDEIRGAHVRVIVAGHTFTATTDEDGVFVVKVKNLPAVQALKPGPAPVTVSVSGPGDIQSRPGTGHVWIHDPAAPLVAVVSDIDDTVVKTYVTDKLKMAGAVLLKNAKQLEPVEGAAANYRKARDAGVGGFFYLSGSPQNFYGRLRTYLDDHGFPQGPLLLKNFGSDPLTKQEGYKARRIGQLLKDMPNMRVILVGDTGEKDPEIYAEVKAQHPDRVAAIVIRKTPGSAMPPGRLDGMTVVDDKYEGEDVLARLLSGVSASTSRTPSPESTEPR